MNRIAVLRAGVVVLLCCMTLSTTADEAATTEVVNQAIDLQGHRGARGLLPENTIPGFQRALNLG